MNKLHATELILVATLALAQPSFGAQRGSASYNAQVNAGDRDAADHRYESALSHYRYALVWNPQGVDAHIGLGTVYIKIGKKQKAIDQLAYVLSIAPHSAAAERQIHIARSEGEEQLAFQELELQVPREPKNADLHTTYAEELVERDRLSDATYQATLALSLDPHQWHAHCALGRIAFKLDHMAEAREHLQIAVQHDPTDDDGLEALGEIELKEGHADKAAADFRLLVRLIPEEADGHLKLATALDALGQHAMAESERKLAANISARSQAAGQ